MRDMDKKHNHDRRRHRERMGADLDYKLRKLLNTIIHRCESPKFRGWKYYGGKGVRNFLTFEDLKVLWNRDGADKMRRASIDIFDNDGHYELSNVHFCELADNIRRARERRHRKDRAA